MSMLIIISILISIPNVNPLVAIGANLAGPSERNRCLPYVNLVRQSSKWGSPLSPSDGNATFDPITGWPTSDFGMALAVDALDLGGTYLLYAQGNAEVIVDGGGSSAGQIVNKTYDPSTNILSAVIILL
jgi:hypothetical protein